MKAPSKSATGRRFRSAIGMLTTTQIETLRRNYECEIVPDWPSSSAPQS